MHIGCTNGKLLASILRELALVSPLLLPHTACFSQHLVSQGALYAQYSKLVCHIRDSNIALEDLILLAVPGHIAGSLGCYWWCVVKVGSQQVMSVGGVG